MIMLRCQWLICWEFPRVNLVLIEFLGYICWLWLESGLEVAPLLILAMWILLSMSCERLICTWDCSVQLGFKLAIFSYVLSFGNLERGKDERESQNGNLVKMKGEARIKNSIIHLHSALKDWRGAQKSYEKRWWWPPFQNWPPRAGCTTSKFAHFNDLSEVPIIDGRGLKFLKLRNWTPPPPNPNPEEETDFHQIHIFPSFSK